MKYPEYHRSTLTAALQKNSGEIPPPLGKKKILAPTEKSDPRKQSYHPEPYQRRDQARQLRSTLRTKSQAFDPDDLHRRLRVVFAERQALGEKIREAKVEGNAKPIPQQGKVAVVTEPKRQSSGSGNSALKDSRAVRAQQTTEGGNAASIVEKESSRASKSTDIGQVKRSKSLGVRRKSSLPAKVVERDAAAPAITPPDSAAAAVSPYHHVPREAAAQFARTATSEIMRHEMLSRSLSHSALRSADEALDDAGEPQVDEHERESPQQVDPVVGDKSEHDTKVSTVDEKKQTLKRAQTLRKRIHDRSDVPERKVQELRRNRFTVPGHHNSYQSAALSHGKARLSDVKVATKGHSDIEEDLRKRGTWCGTVDDHHHQLQRRPLAHSRSCFYPPAATTNVSHYRDIDEVLWSEETLVVEPPYYAGVIHRRAVDWSQSDQIPPSQHHIGVKSSLERLRRSPSTFLRKADSFLSPKSVKRTSGGSYGSGGSGTDEGKITVIHEVEAGEDREQVEGDNRSSSISSQVASPPPARSHKSKSRGRRRPSSRASARPVSLKTPKPLRFGGWFWSRFRR